MYKFVWTFLFVALILSSLSNVAYGCKVGKAPSMQSKSEIDIRQIKDSCGWDIPYAGKDKYQCICLRADKNRKVTCIGSLDQGDATNVYLASGGPADYVYIISTNNYNTMDSYKWAAEKVNYNCDCSTKSGPGKKWNYVCGSL